MPDAQTSTAENLAWSDLRVDDSSYTDPNGFLFHWRGGLYRALRPGREAFFRGLFEDGTIAALTAERGLVESSLTRYTVAEAECGAVLAHERIAPLSYCVEWCPSMLREAALTTLRLAVTLLERNCTLQDAYPWNVLFRGPRPVFVDLTSIVPIESGLLWPAYQQFMSFFLAPLELGADGKGKLARALLFDSINGISGTDLRRALSAGYKLRHPLASAAAVLSRQVESRIQDNASMRARLQGATAKASLAANAPALRARFFEGLIRRVEGLRAPRPSSRWASYYEGIDADTARKVASVGGLLERLAPADVLDLGCNVGRYSVLAAELGYRVTAVDSSEDCIEGLYRHSVERDLPILPLVADVLAPTPAFGHLARQFPSMPDRLQSDVVLCLGLMHHLHVTGRQSFERITELLDALSRRAVILEYVDFKDDNLDLIDHGRRIDYDLERVRRALEARFATTVFDSDRPTRRILLCEKR